MLATNRSRSRVLVSAVLAGLVLSTVVWAASDRAYENERDDFVDAAHAKLDGVSTQEVVDLWDEEIVDAATGVASALRELLEVDGHTPERVWAPEDRSVAATYTIEAWGQDGTVLVRWSDDGFEIDAD